MTSVESAVLVGNWVEESATSKNIKASMPEQREDKERHHESPRKKSTGGADKNMATQSQGIKQLMAAEKEAAQVVADARKSECETTSANELKYLGAG